MGNTVEKPGAPKPWELASHEATLWKGVLDLASEALIVGDGEGLIRYANPAAEQLLGWEPGTLEGQPIHVLIPAGMRDQHERGFRRYRQTRVPRVLGRTIRVPVVRRNGTEVRLELTLSALPESGGFTASLRPPRGSAAPEGGRSLGRVLQALLASIDALSSPFDIEELPRVISGLLTSRFGATLARVWMYDAETRTLRQPGRTRRRIDAADPLKTDVRLDGDAFVAAAVGRTGIAHVKNDLSVGGDFDPEWVRRYGLQSVALLPLTGCGRLQGVIGYFSSEPVSGELVRVLEAFARAAGTAAVEAERRRLEARVQELRGRARGLATLISSLDSTPFEALVEEALRLAREQTGADQASLAWLDGSEWVVEACSGYGSPINGYRYPESLGAAAEVRRTEAPVGLPDYFGFPGALPPLRQRGVRSVLAVPVTVAGAVTGALQLEWKRPVTRFDPELVEAAAAIAGCVGASRQVSRVRT